MSYVQTSNEQPEVRLKKIAAKSFSLKSPSQQQPTADKADGSSSTESFKSAVTAEIDSRGIESLSNDVVDAETEDIIPPARLVASIDSPALKSAESGKKVKAKTAKNLPKEKSNPTKPLKGGFWEVETILDVRQKGKRYEYLVQWKGDYENTWEPQTCLNKNALREAKELLAAKTKQPDEEVDVEPATTTAEGLFESGDANS